MKYNSNFLTRTKILSMLSSAALTAASTVAFAGPVFEYSIDIPDQLQTKCSLSKEYVLEELKSGTSITAISGKLSQCLPETMSYAVNSFTEVKYNVSYEELTGCGYHPQAKSFHCAVDVKRRFGYGNYDTNPPQASGTFEWVTVCVDNGSGLQIVGTSGVHLHDEHLGVEPNWMFGIEIPVEKEMYGTQYGLGTPLDQRSLRARTILSWAAPVTSCNQIPVWGNILNFKIRLDV